MSEGTAHCEGKDPFPCLRLQSKNVLLCCFQSKEFVVLPWLVWFRARAFEQKLTGSIPSQGTCLGCRPGPHLGACQRHLINVSFTHLCVSPSLSPSLPL